MIFQIDYKSNNKYQKYFNYNKRFLLDYKLFNDNNIQEFLNQYDYNLDFKIDVGYEYATNAILCDALRLMILYELGGVYIDADVYFKPNIINLESNLFNDFGNRTIILSTKSFYFMRAPKHSRYIKYILDLYLRASKLKLDIHMLKKLKLKEYLDEIMIIRESYLEPFFTHEQITTGNK